jgi:hypothetical protein
MTRREERKDAAYVRMQIDKAVRGGLTCDSIVWGLRDQMTKQTGFFFWFGPRFATKKPITVNGRIITDRDWLFNSATAPASIKRNASRWIKNFARF